MSSIRKPRFWIARNEHSGSVFLFDGMPIKDNGFFYDRVTFERGLYIGMRPQLPFDLKRGEKARVDLSFMTRGK